MPRAVMRPFDYQFARSCGPWDVPNRLKQLHLHLMLTMDPAWRLSHQAYHLNDEQRDVLGEWGAATSKWALEAGPDEAKPMAFLTFHGFFGADIWLDIYYWPDVRRRNNMEPSDPTTFSLGDPTRENGGFDREALVDVVFENLNKVIRAKG